MPPHLLLMTALSDDVEDGGEASERDILGKKKRGPKKKKEIKKKDKDKDGKTPKARKRKKIVCHSNQQFSFYFTFLIRFN